MLRWKSKKQRKSQDIAIIGLTGRFPGANSIEEYWNNLCEGKESISFFTDEELIAAGVNESLIHDPNYIKAAPTITDVDMFDAEFFSYSPREAEAIDPQQRLLLEHAWQLLESAGYSLSNHPANIGVFCGSGGIISSYFLECFEADPTIKGKTTSYSHLGNDKDFLATRISYKLNLKGPSVTLQTACSTSLVTVHQACQSLIGGECDMALAGGVNIRVPQQSGYVREKGHVFSTDGHCRPFDADAQGIIFGSGVGLVLLKPLDKALADNDLIYAVIKGSAINNDGGTKMSYMASSAVGQKECIAKALEHADISPESIGYIEAHGTGTAMGDPVEITALKEAFKDKTDKIHYCAIGSVKANIGHVDIASGIASLVKAILIVRHKKIPPQINFKKLNPKIILENSPFYINNQLKDWPCSSNLKHIGVNSLGIGGTNVFMILGPPPSVNSLKPVPKLCYLFLLSAKTNAALEQKIRELEQWLIDNKNIKLNLDEISYTLAAGRTHFDKRCAFIAKSVNDLQGILHLLNAGKTPANVVSNITDLKNLDTNVISKEEAEVLSEKYVNHKYMSLEYYQDILMKLAKFYSNGYSIDWRCLFSGKLRRIIQLPTYPFIKKRYWISNKKIITAHKELLHYSNLSPVLHKANSNTTTLYFTKTLNINDFYLSDHIVKGGAVLPAAAFIEMIRAAYELLFPCNNTISIHNIVWIEPLTVKSEQSVAVRFYIGDTKIEFRVTSIRNLEQKKQGDEITYAQGSVSFQPITYTRLSLLIDEIKRRCNKRQSLQSIYPKFETIGLQYGPAFQVVQELWYNEKEILSKLVIPSHLNHTVAEFVIHPSLLDGAFQTLYGLLWNEDDVKKLYLPFLINQIDILEKIPQISFVYATMDPPIPLSDIRKFQIQIMNESGKVLADINDFTMRIAHAHQISHDILYYQPLWKHLSTCYVGAKHVTGSLLVFDNAGSIANVLRAALPIATVISVKSSSTANTNEENEYYINSKETSSYEQLINSIIGRKNFPGFIIYVVERIVPSAINWTNKVDEIYYSLLFLVQALLKHQITDDIELLFIQKVSGDEAFLLTDALGGFANTLHLEHPKFKCRIINIRQDKQIIDEIDQPDSIVEYDNTGFRYIKAYQQFQVSQTCGTFDLLRKNGVYLITGGLGGLGKIFSHYLIERYQAKLIVIGRSALTPEREKELEQWRQLGSEVTYIQADISKSQEFQQLQEKIKPFINKLNGVIHCAGIINDAFIINKKPESSAPVLSAKISGAVLLDELTKLAKLDFFILFSSVSSVLGNLGQVDYGYANGFQDSFAKWREQLNKSNLRYGKTMSINWPLWADGGMAVEKTARDWLMQTFGMIPISSHQGISVFKNVLNNAASNQIIIIQGEKSKIEKRLNIAPDFKDPNIELNESEQAVESVIVFEKIQSQLIVMLADILRIKIQNIDIEEHFSEYGMDSINVIAFTNKLNQYYNLDLSPTLFFEHRTLKNIAEFILKHHAKAAALKHVDKVQTVQDESTSLTSENTLPSSALCLHSPLEKSASQKRLNDIAIIGISGVFPGSPNLDVYWDNLIYGKDLITEIPPSRWDWNKYYGDGEDKIKSKWGGFINDIDKFDAEFFNISPLEAELMDPQQRIFLHVVWNLIENAGYSSKELAKNKTGLFVGVSTHDYAELLQHAQCTSAHVSTGTIHSILPNRISYILNLCGPSEAIDTACSSSLVAIHNAIRAIQNNDCDMAIAGGVNALLTPSLFKSFTDAGMLSEDGRCKTFDKSANGYVRGEGAGAILLKPLDCALADGDTIYGVIKGTAINHGGHVSSLTVPNPLAQAEVIIEACERSETDIDTITYIETHGTGTALGDPIEINGLKKAFNYLCEKQGKKINNHYCGLGSVKTNIGHLEAAAGIAGLIKILLSMKHSKVPKNINFTELNPYINLTDSPFYIINSSSEWVRLKDKFDKDIPRRAGISSFGFGGVNAHIVIEEPPISISSHLSVSKASYLIALSAKTESALKQRIFELSLWLKENIELSETTTLANISYMLNVGRDHFDSRCAIIVSSLAELKIALHQLINHQGANAIWLSHEVIDASQRKISKKECDQIYYAFCVTNHSSANNYEGSLKDLAYCYTQGHNIDFSLVYRDEYKQKIVLPNYPFRKERFWVSPSDNQVTKTQILSNQSHIFIDENVSTLSNQSYIKKFTGEEFYIKEHRIKNTSVLPAAVYIEMIRAIAILAMPEKYVLGLKDILWIKTIDFEGEYKSITTTLSSELTNTIFEVLNYDGTVHAQGKIKYGEIGDIERLPSLNIAEIKSRCIKEEQAEQIYSRFNTLGLNYGPSFQAIRALWSNEREAIAKLQLPEHLYHSASDFMLHPSLLDGAFQSTIGLLSTSLLESKKLYLPFSIEQINVYQSLPASCYAYVTRSSEANTTAIEKFTIQIVDEAGQVLVAIKDLSLRAIENSKQLTEVYYYKPIWQQAACAQFNDASSSVVVFSATDEMLTLLKEKLPKSVVIAVRFDEEYRADGKYHYTINQQRAEDYVRLWQEISAAGLSPEQIFYCTQLSYPEVTGDEAINAQLQQSYYSLLYLSQALILQKPQENIYIMCANVTSADRPALFTNALAGFAKTLMVENPKLICRVIDIKDQFQAKNIVDILVQEISQPELEVKYDESQVRHIKSYEAIEDKEQSVTELPIKVQGVYLISGGAGGLGLLFAKYLAEHYQAKLILMGRSELTENQQLKLKELERFNAEVIYRRVDITKREAIESVLQEVKSQFGAINGVIHSAGVIRDAFILKKNAEESKGVLAPKIVGTINLDEVMHSESFDFFVMFSSIASILGNIGQCDYAYANSFMNGYAEYREKERKQGRRSGETIAISWPLWAEGGMGIDRGSEQWMEETLGLVPLKTSDGFQAFIDLLRKRIPQAITIAGQKQKINLLFQNIRNPIKQNRVDPPIHIQLPESEANIKTQEYLKRIISDTIKIPIDKLKAHIYFAQYGIDSVIIMNLNRRLAKDFDNLPKTLFFEYQTIHDLANYFISNHWHTLANKLSLTRDHIKSASQESVSSVRSQIIKQVIDQPIHNIPENDRSIAIIGISGRYPQAPDIEVFWENLKFAKDAITTIPLERWNSDIYFDENKESQGTSYSRWGGFINDVDKFDPFFFNISPREAELMDPQERLFLETAWMTIEDAGYNPDTLTEKQVGVFVGVMYGEYQLLAAEQSVTGNTIAVNSFYASIANRVSYCFNFSGPSMAVDTMCSSSLTAIHMACKSILNGECEIALAGGVNLNIHPNKYLLLSQGKFLSSDGRCRSFGEGGDGYVPGEGVGAVLLKPLTQALEAGDHIYGVIKGSSVNHGGKTTGYTVPNPMAQSAVIKKAINEANFAADTISYIETHGTGTSLGDPIEIAGLSKVYNSSDSFTKCSIGSVKSNIGHLEAAAGIAAVTKVLLQMQYQTLVPSIHTDKLNSNIDWENAPFKVQKELSPWPRVSILDNGESCEIPRRAGISSFGAGGSNAHLILEEGPSIKSQRRKSIKPYYLIVLSAKTEPLLQRRIQDLAKWIQRKEREEYFNDILLEDISYTLNVGRSHLEKRCAIVSKSMYEFKETLLQLSNNITLVNVFRSGKEAGTVYHSGVLKKMHNQCMQEIVNNNQSDAQTYYDNLLVLADLYASGYDLDFDRLHYNESRRRISLPTYPFAKERYWIPQNKNNDKKSIIKSSVLHPLIDANISTLTSQCFTKLLNSKEFYLKDHDINNQYVLPGAALLEIARAAGTFAVPEQRVVNLCNIIWAKPIYVADTEVQTKIALLPQEDAVDFVVTTQAKSDQINFHASGKIIYGEISDIERLPSLNIAEMKSRCIKEEQAEQIYSRFNTLGLNYGPSFQAIRALWSNEREAIAKLQLPEHLCHSASDFVLHPSLLDGAFQSTIGLLKTSSPESKKLYLPFSIEQINVYQSLPASCYAYVTRSSEANTTAIEKFTIQIIDEAGQVLIAIKDLSLRALENIKQSTEVYYYKPIWQQAACAQSNGASSSVVVFSATDEMLALLKEKLPKSVVIAVRFDEEYRADGKHHYAINQQRAEDYVRLWQEISAAGLSPEQIFYCTQLSYPKVTGDEAINVQLQQSYYSLLYLSQALIQQKPQENIYIMCANVSSAERPALFTNALAGFAKTLMVENPKLICRVIDIKDQVQAKNIVDILVQEINQRELEVKYDESQVRHIKNYEAIEDREQIGSELPIKVQGVYLISGGVGGLGLLFAKYLAEHYQAKLILMGRSELTENQQLKLKELERFNAEVIYRRVDITKREAIENVLQEVKSQFGVINGVIHSAGVIRDAFILKKSAEESKGVLAPKIVGTINLDEVMYSEPVDFFVMFSSIASILGNIGQCDYAYANSFMNGYAEYREKERKQGRRSGETIAISWPLWAEGGMGIDRASEQWMEETLGLVPLKTSDGFQAFIDALNHKSIHQIVLAGEKYKHISLLSLNGYFSQSSKEPAITEQFILENTTLKQKTEYLLKELVADIIKASPERISVYEPFEKYGIDSVMIMALTRKLEQTFGPLSKTLFFEYQSLEKLIDYFISQHEVTLSKLFGPLPVSNMQQPNIIIQKSSSSLLGSRFDSTKQPFIKDNSSKHISSEDIAIIGMSGKYPQAENLDVFWENLKSGKDCITEVPAERQNIFYRNNDFAKNIKRRGGFIDNVDVFDPLLFNISPREAEIMDPQERLFLQTTWQTLEDAGYTRESLEKSCVGVFVGVMYGEYQLFGAEELLKGNLVATNSSYASIANRVSYYFNFRGPSIALDTMCSSSLTAMHFACDSLRLGRCQLAVAGGVNISIHHNKYILLEQSKFLSSDGYCRSFGKGGDGYVPGEGVGAVLLKPLSKAIADGDHIYGVIKGSFINHGGKTNGYTVPNVNAQIELIEEAFVNARVNTETITYVEAHGTGTSLGDPIEITALSRVFNKTSNKHPCAIGSVKSNIGHLEAAAGIAAVTKVLLQMQHKTLVPSLHSDKLNQNIPWEKIPFKVQRELSHWPRLTIEENGYKQEILRRASISSFGAGGSNAHLIIEEATEFYLKLKPPHKPYYLITLSAKTEEILKNQLMNLLAWIEQKSSQLLSENIALEDISYTLNIGRTHFEHRCALVVSSLDELKHCLQQYKEDQSLFNDFMGSISDKAIDQITIKEKCESLLKDISCINLLPIKDYHEKLVALAKFYLEGLNLDWELLHLGEGKRRISLPTYPFAEKRCWIQQDHLTNITSFNSNNEQMLSKAKPYLFLTKSWQYCSGLSASYTRFSGIFVIMVDEYVNNDLRNSIKKISDREPIFILITSSNSNSIDNTYVMPHGDADKGKQLAKEILAHHSHLAGIIDLSDLVSKESTKEQWGKIAFLQELLAYKNKESLYLLHITNGLQLFKNSSGNLIGAEMAALVRMLGAEYKKLIAKTIDIDSIHNIDEVIINELNVTGGSGEICYRDGQRFLPHFESKETGLYDPSINFKHNLSIHSDKVYVITGGTRGIGSVLAKYLVSRGVKKLVLMGQQSLPARESWKSIIKQNDDALAIKKITNILALEAENVKIEIYCGSLADQPALEEFFSDIRKDLGPIAGVIHCAGLLINHHPAFINKKINEMQAVCEPKVRGLLVLHDIFKHDNLDFFVLSSSISAQIPRLAAGVCDYAMANGFMDYFAAYQCSHGHNYYYSIAWPNWHETGMGEVSSLSYQQTGVSSLSNKDALFLFDGILANKYCSSILPCIVNNDIFKLDSLLTMHNASSAINPQSKVLNKKTNSLLPLLTESLSELLKISITELNINTAFSEYGVDSILLAEFVKKIEPIIESPLDPSIIIEYPTLKDLSGFLLEKFPNINLKSNQQFTEPLSQEKLNNHKAAENKTSSCSTKIAVIGMACHLPGAADLDTYWQNLSSGLCSIIEIPSSRWSIEQFYSPDHQVDKSISKWGGFISDIEYFDSTFFGIKEEDAPQIDPLMRQVLEVTTQTLCDAGYEKNQLWNKKVGVFIGSRVSNYSERIHAINKSTITGIGQNFISAYLSHIFNFKGPSIVVDTACSSSLVSLHLACQSLSTGESEVAIAGGVDILLDERPYLILSKAQALSIDGKCHTFDESANGFVPGEGCGIVMLKSLDRALVDGDKIYGVIEASAINNDGHTMGVTTPNPQAQRAVITDAFNKSTLDVASISYIETHGTGTFIGDPIELKALTAVFNSKDTKKQFCAVGSVKTNIGHTLSAAGIASFIKVMLMLHHKKLVPSLHCKKPNPRFNFTDSPFYPSLQLTHWETEAAIRCAGISSFGFGGTNAFCLVSEHNHSNTYLPRSSLPPIDFHRKYYWLNKANKMQPILKDSMNHFDIFFEKRVSV